MLRPGAKRYRKSLGAVIFGAATLALLVVVVASRSEERQFIRLFESASPLWLVGALVLQIFTYFAQAATFQMATAMERELSWSASAKLSFVKLFADQALPFPGSGILATAQALRYRGLSPHTVAACIAMLTVAYYFAFILLLAGALLAATLLGEISRLFLFGFGVFSTAAAWFVWAVTRLTSGSRVPGERLLVHVPGWKRLTSYFRSGTLPEFRISAPLAGAVLLQMSIFLLDAMTLYSAARALGQTAHPGSVFVSYMAALLAQSLAMVPGGLGVYEVTSTAVLTLSGLSLPAALSATILFRGLSYWLPLIPGVYFTRKALVLAQRNTDLND